MELVYTMGLNSSAESSSGMLPALNNFTYELAPVLLSQKSSPARPRESRGPLHLEIKTNAKSSETCPLLPMTENLESGLGSEEWFNVYMQNLRASLDM